MEEGWLPPEVLAHVFSFIVGPAARNQEGTRTKSYLVFNNNKNGEDDDGDEYGDEAHDRPSCNYKDIPPLDASFDGVTPVVCRFVCRQWNQVLLSLGVVSAPQPYGGPRDHGARGARQPYYFDASLHQKQQAMAPLYGLDKDLVAQAAGRGWLSVARWLLDNRCSADCNLASRAAARGGYGSVLEWLRRVNREEPSLRWIRSKSISRVGVHQNPVWDEAICALAARGGHLRVLQWLRTNGCPWSDTTLNEAALAGHFELVRWARANGAPWSRATCAAAALGGHASILKWLRMERKLGWAVISNHCEWDESTCSSAARGGHLELLKWARANGCPWSEATYLAAARNGHLEVLRWIRPNGCPWSGPELAASYAARGGHINVLQWLFDERGCSYNGRDYLAAAAKGRHLDVARWLHYNGYATEVKGALHVAARLGDDKMIEWLHEQGSQILDREVCRQAARGGHLEILKWARSNGYPWDETTCSSAAEAGYLAVLQWLRCNGCPWDESTLWCAVNHEDVLRWARQAGCPGSERYSSYYDEDYECCCSWCLGEDENEAEPMMPKDARQLRKGSRWNTRRWQKKNSVT